MIDWAGPVPFGEQGYVVRNIAALYVRRGTYGRKVNFTHLLVEGQLTFRGRGNFGTFSGTRFFADFGTHHGKPWYCEFLLPARSEYIDIDENSIVIMTYVENGRVLSQELVDIDQCHVTEGNILSSD